MARSLRKGTAKSGSTFQEPRKVRHRLSSDAGHEGHCTFLRVGRAIAIYGRLSAVLSNLNSPPHTCWSKRCSHSKKKRKLRGAPSQRKISIGSRITMKPYPRFLLRSPSAARERENPLRRGPPRKARWPRRPLLIFRSAVDQIHSHWKAWKKEELQIPRRFSKKKSLDHVMKP